MNEIEEKLNELKRLDFDEEAFDEEERLSFSAQNRFIDSLIEWYKIFENKDEATTHNCFWSYFFLIIQEFLIKSKYGEKQPIESGSFQNLVEAVELLGSAAFEMAISITDLAEAWVRVSR